MLYSLFSPIFGTAFTLSPSAVDASGKTIWGALLWLVLLLIFCIYRSKKKSISVFDYISLKYIRLNNLVNSAEIIKSAVDEYNRTASDASSTASYTRSEVYGAYVAVRGDDGRLLAEVPSRRIGSWFWVVVTVFIVYSLA